MSFTIAITVDTLWEIGKFMAYSGCGFMLGIFATAPPPRESDPRTPRPSEFWVNSSPSTIERERV